MFGQRKSCTRSKTHKHKRFSHLNTIIALKCRFLWAGIWMSLLSVNGVASTALCHLFCRHSVFPLATVSLLLPNYFPLSLSTGALCQECHLVERDEARLLPRPCSLSGLLQVRPFIPCNAINIQISYKLLAEQTKAGHVLISAVWSSVD